MKSLTPIIAITIAMMLSVPAAAQVVYNNGPINGNNDAWTINLTFAVSDTFTISNGAANVTGLSFGAWLSPGDTLTSAEVSITSLENGGTTYFDQMVNFTASNCVNNEYGFEICTESGSFNAGNFTNGTYWLNLQNADVPGGDPIYWDQNSGVGCTSPGCPSSASDNAVGSIESEAFTILGSASSTSSTTSVPEPSSLILFASGVLGLGALVRRKLM
ncbi:MAG: PEP-CTERM sorting domain-containing protein [Candidatus Korobacteraceae bacterium]